MLKILQARLQWYVKRELSDVQAGFRKGRGNRDQIANIRWISKKARDFQKNIYFCFIDYAKAFDCVQRKKRKWSCSVMSDCLWPHGLEPTRFLHPWDFPGKNTGVGCHFLLQEIFLTQGLNPGLPHCRQTLYHLSHQGSPSCCCLCIFRLNHSVPKLITWCVLDWSEFCWLQQVSAHQLGGSSPHMGETGLEQQSAHRWCRGRFPFLARLPRLWGGAGVI